jgi:phosphoglycolate phosphatase-like HAD superfamily hydrolase
VLFDIDGTLLTSMAAGRQALLAAFAEHYGDLNFFDSVRFDGKTDGQIVAELHAAAGFPGRATAEQTARLLDRYLSHLERAVAEPAGRVRPCPGVVELLDALEARSDVVIGLLTGNVVPGAKLKLTAAGIGFERFRVGAYGSDSTHRPALPPIAAERATALFGRTPTGEEVVIIGDTPADVACGAGINARAVAVATGSYSVTELEATGAYVTFPTLADTGAVLKAIIT